MKITIFNANDSNAEKELDILVDNLKNKLSGQHEVETLTLRDLNINYCNGCWGCWVKEPGQCVIKDESYFGLSAVY